LNFEKMQIFILLYELQSFSGVARELGVNQSVISRTIQDLESSFGRKLILNNQKPILLTEDGLKLYKILKKTNSDMNNVRENLVYQKKTFEDFRIKINIAIEMVFSFVLAEKLKKLLETFPEIMIDISFIKNITMDLINKKDIIIMKNPYDHILVENHFIKEYPMVFCASREYLKKYGYPKTPENLKYHKFIYVKDYDYEHFASSEITNFLSKRFVVDNEFCAIKAVEFDGGIGIFPTFFAKNFKNIAQFEMETQKLRKIKVNIASSKLKKNSYTQLILNFFNSF